MSLEALKRLVNGLLAPLGLVLRSKTSWDSRSVELESLNAQTRTLRKRIAALHLALESVDREGRESAPCEAAAPASRSVGDVKLVWEDEGTLRVNDVTFVVTDDIESLRSMKSTANSFILAKTPDIIDRYVAIGREHNIRKVFEMGILQGGSVVFYDQLFPLKRIAAIDRLREPVEALEEYISGRGDPARVAPFYGVDQSDRETMEDILSSEFPLRDIDLVIDDASHLYYETREAFNIVFPYLREGGLYVIEDWAWAHWPGHWQSETEALFGFERPSPTNLVVELLMLSASANFIKNISLDSKHLVVQRGAGELPQGKFDISDHYLLRGRPFQSWI